MDINGHLLTPIWEVPPILPVQSCIAPPPYKKRRPGEGAAIVYSFSPGAGDGKGGIAGGLSPTERDWFKYPSEVTEVPTKDCDL